jgi:histidine ammonia-lyase
MAVTLDIRRDFTLDAFRRVAWEGEDAVLSEGARRRMAEARTAFERLIEEPGITVYGVTSGYGQHASKRLGPKERRDQARHPPHGPAVAFGRPLPERVSRGIVFARLANFIEGHAAVTPALAEAVAGLLQGKLPPVAMEGQGGAGEIVGLAPLFVGLAERFELKEKEALALVNGSPIASAMAADGALAARRRLALVEEVFALSVEAFKAPLEAYAPELGRLWNDPFEAEALAALGLLLEGAGAERRPYQAPVSYRILPRVLAQYRRALATAEEVAGHALAAVTDNPVFLAPDDRHPLGRVMSTGGYHNGMAYPALDGLAAAAADLCLIADRHTTKLLDGRVSLLPDQLQAGEGYVGCLGFVQVGYGEQARRAAQRTFLPGSEGGGFGQNDVAEPIFAAWQAQAEAGRCLEAAAACLGVVASQALFVTERPAPPRLRGLLEDIRCHCPPVTEPRMLAPEMARLAALFERRVHGEAAA